MATKHQDYTSLYRQRVAAAHAFLQPGKAYVQYPQFSPGHPNRVKAR